MDVVQQLRAELSRIWERLNRRQRLLIGILGVSSLLALGLFAVWASKPEYATAYTGLSERDAADIVDILQNIGVPYRLTDNGTAIQVPAQDVYRARLEVARQGLPRGGSIGFELFDQGGLGALGMTEFTQRVNFQRALEGELARTIAAMENVEQARVHLVIPEKRLFAQEQAKPTASVMLALRPGRRLSEEQVWAIGNLVASSVEGLEPEYVTIVDVRGRVLAEGGVKRAGEGSRLRLSLAQISAERDVETELENRLQRMLDTALGSNKAVVRVSADLNWAQVETTSERYEPQAATGSGVIRSFRQTIESTGGITVTGGVPGVDANVLPIYQPVITSTQEAGLVRNDTVVNYEISKTVMRTVSAPGDIERVSVAVLLDSNDPNLVAQQPAIEQMIRAAIGYNSERGDVVTVDFLPFSNELAEEAQALEEAQRRALYLNLARAGVAVLGLLLLLFFLRRTFHRLEERVLVTVERPQPPQLEAPVEAVAAEAGLVAEPGSVLDMLEKAEEYTQLDLEDIRRRKRMATVAQEQPETVARVIQRWLAEEE